MPHRPTARPPCGIDEADELLVDGAGQHHLDDLDAGGIGDAMAVGEFGLDAEPVQHFRDLRPAAMHDHGIEAGLLEQHDVAGEVAGDLLVAHGMAAILDDDDRIVMALHMRQGLGQDRGLVVRADIDGHGWSVLPAAPVCCMRCRAGF